MVSGGGGRLTSRLAMTKGGGTLCLLILPSPKISSKNTRNTKEFLVFHVCSDVSRVSLIYVIYMAVS